MAAAPRTVRRVIVIRWDGPVRGKGRGRATIVGGHARVYTDAKTRTCEAQLRFAAQQAMATQLPLDGAVRLSMAAAIPIPDSWSKKKKAAALLGALYPTTKPDADNILKLADALNGVVWRDDRQVVEATVTKRYSDRPGLTIEVTALESV